MPAMSPLLGAFAGVVLLAASASADPTWVSGINVQQACDDQWGAGLSAGFDTDFPSAYSWKCMKGTDVRLRVDLDAWCKKHEGADTYADPQGGGPWDWACYRP